MAAPQHQPDPLFTVVTVTLNPGPDLEETVRTVLGQTFRDFELIIKDGGSTDGTENETWEDSRVRRVTSPDTGIFDAMNQALGLATGKYVHFLNAGDTFVDERVLADVAAAIHAHPDVPFFFGNVEKPRSRSGYEMYPPRLHRRFMFLSGVCHQACFVARATYLASGGFETTHRAGADPRLLMRMLVRDRLQHRHVGRVVVRYKGGGVSAQPEHRIEATAWCNELKRELFTSREHAIYSRLQEARQLAKRMVYDAFLWRIHRGMRGTRSAR
jgi:glycosyltransferase involved in cell wall biosynthesis